MRTALLALIPWCGLATAGETPAPEVAATLRLPAAYDQFQVCGGGRFLALRLVENGGIVIVDVAERAIVHTIERPPEDALVCGGRDFLLLVSPGRRLLQRYRLDDDRFRRDAVKSLPYEGTPRIALMGGDSNGPLLLGGERAVLVDGETLEPIDVEGPLIGSWTRYDYAARVSADGRTFTGIPRGYGPVGYTRMRVDGDRTTLGTFGSTSHANRWAQPTAGGHLLLMPGGGMHGPHLEPSRVEWLNESTLFPTIDPRYFLAVRFVPHEGASTTRLAICTTADRRVVHTIVGLPEMAPRGNTNSRNEIAGRLVRGEARYHWIPALGTLVTLPDDDSSILFRDLDLDAALESAGEPYVFVESVPPTTVAAGSRFAYRLATRSSQKKVRYELLDAPAGMRLARRGHLVWKVPTDHPPGRETILVGVANDDRETFHTFDIEVAPRPAAEEE